MGRVSVGRGAFGRAVLVNWAGTLLGVLSSIVLSRWALKALGPDSLGVWYMLLQGAALLALLDLGALALGPRDVAVAVGQDGDEGGLRAARARRAQLLRQWPLAAIGALLAYLALSPGHAEASSALVVLLGGWAVLYPLRYGQVVLQGLNDQAFLGLAVLLATLAGTAAGIAGLELGWGLVSLPIGWTVQQGLGAALVLGRVATRHGPRWLFGAGQAPPLLDSRNLMAAGSGLVHALFAGTDVLFVGTLVGASEAAGLGATTRLVGFAALLGATVAQLGIPVLAQAFGRGGLQEVVQETVLLGFMCATVTGALAVGASGLNASFVSLWLEPGLYAGDLVTLALAGHAVLRQILTAIAFGLLASGRDRSSFLIAGLETGAYVAVLPLALRHGLGVVAVPACQFATGALALIWFVALFPRGGPVGVSASWFRGVFTLLALLGWAAACLVATVWLRSRLALSTLPAGLLLGSAGAVLFLGGALGLSLSFASTREVAVRLRARLGSRG